MNKLSEYGIITLQQHNQTTGALQNLLSTIYAVDNRIQKVDLSVSGAAGTHYSNSYSFSAVVPNLRAATGNERSMVRCLHGQLPTGVDLQIAREATWVSDAVTDVDAFLLIPAADQESRLLADHNAPFYIDHNTTAGTVGVFKMQAKKVGAGVIPAYNYGNDQGNSGLVIFQIDIPYTDGELSGRAAESALETVNTGPTKVFLRPFGQNILNPLEPWRMVGCLSPEINMTYMHEYSEVTKGYKENKISVTLKKQLTSLKCKSTGDTVYLARLLEAGITQDLGYAVVVSPSYSGKKEEFECVLESRSADGQIRLCHIPRAVVNRDGDVTEGGKEKTIPFVVEGMEPANFWFFENLFQTIFISATVTVS